MLGPKILACSHWRAEIRKMWRMAVGCRRTAKLALSCCQTVGPGEPSKCEFLAIPFLGIHPKGIAMVVHKTTPCQRWSNRLSESACAIRKKQSAAGLAGLKQATGQTPSISSSLVCPEQCPHPEGMDPLLCPGLFPHHHPRPWHLPMQSPEQKEEVAEARAV